MTRAPALARLLASVSQWHLGSGGNATANTSAPLPAAYGIGASCTFNSNDPCQADSRTGNTSVDIVDRAMAFIVDAQAAKRPFYVHVWLHVSHNKLDPTAAQKAAANNRSSRAGGGAGGICKQSELAQNQTECADLVFIAAQQDADAQLGRLHALLGQLDLHESTLVLFATDNGWVPLPQL